MTDGLETPATAPPKKAGFGCLAVIVVIGALAAFGALFGGSDGDEPSADDLQYTAFEICKEFVTDRLAAPGTAVFRNYFEDDGEVVVSGVGDGPYTVTSSVDSENGFGALLRTDFVCEVRRAGGDTWNLVDITMV